MEITSVQITDFINRTAVSETNMAQSLKVGDILVLRIESMDSGALLFSDNKGSFLMASTADSASLSLGDTVEMIVNGMADNQYTLKILDVMHETAQADEALAGDLATRGENPGLAKVPSMAVLTTAMTMMKQNPQIPPKLASFMAENQIGPLAEQVEALNQMQSTQTQTGALLYEIFSGLAELIQPEALTMVSEPSQPTELDTDLPMQGESAPSQTTAPEKTASQIAKTADAKPQVLPAQNEAETVPQNTEELAQQAKTASKLEQIQSLLKSAWDVDASGAIKGDKDLPLKQVLTKVLAAFYAPDEPKNARALKKTVENLALQLKELKVLLESNDIKSKETFLVKTTQAEKQMETLTEAKQINCFHLPIWLGNRPASTAELYVYQRKQNTSNPKKKRLTALVGIDTPNLGRVEAMIGLNRLSVDMDIGVERNDVLTAFEKSREVLAAAFEKLGYQMASFKAGMLEARTTVLNAKERLTQHSEMSNDRLDVRI